VDDLMSAAAFSSSDSAERSTEPVELAIGGMTCAACATRVERKLNKLDGVSATVNYATEEASVTTDDAVELDTLISQVENAGYSASPIERDSGDAELAQTGSERVRYLWRRLVVALICGVPAADLSITLALVPSLRFTGWAWVVFALMGPVVTWCAYPFHYKAFVAARHGASSMDTLVSLGIVAASAWSTYTIFFHPGTVAESDGLLGLILKPGGAIYL